MLGPNPYLLCYFSSAHRIFSWLPHCQAWPYTMQLWLQIAYGVTPVGDHTFLNFNAIYILIEWVHSYPAVPLRISWIKFTRRVATFPNLDASAPAITGLWVPLHSLRAGSSGYSASLLAIRSVGTGGPVWLVWQKEWWSLSQTRQCVATKILTWCGKRSDEDTPPHQVCI